MLIFVAAHIVYLSRLETRPRTPVVGFRVASMTWCASPGALVSKRSRLVRRPRTAGEASPALGL